MTPYLQDADCVLYHGDALDVLRTLPDRSVHMCATSPPFYGLRSYLDDGHEDKHIEIGLEDTPDQWVARLVDVFREVRRVLRDDGTLWVEIGDSYKSTAPGTVNAPERIAGTGGRGGSAGEARARMRPLLPDLKSKDMIGQPWLLAFALRADGWYLRSEIIWHKVNAMPESVTDRPTKAHSTIFLLSKKPRYYFDSEAIREPHKEDGRKVTTVVGRDGSLQHRDGERWPGSGANARSVWPMTTQPYSARAQGHGTSYIASADCPKHGLRADPEKWRAAARGERSAVQGVYRIDGNDARRALEQEPSDASTASRIPEARSAASPHSSETSRTDPAPGTSPSCTPSAQTAVRIGDTPASPESSENGGRTPSSSSAVDDPYAQPEQDPSAQTPSRTAGRCTCTESSVDHFATWPEKLVARMIAAGTSERGCCPECGAPWERDVETDGEWRAQHDRPQVPGNPYRANPGGGLAGQNTTRTRSVLGWQPSCAHDTPPVPATILDVFGGSGTTALVARKHGRHSILIELNESYCQLAADRLAQQSLLTELA